MPIHNKEDNYNYCTRVHINNKKKNNNNKDGRNNRPALRRLFLIWNKKMYAHFNSTFAKSSLFQTLY